MSHVDLERIKERLADRQARRGYLENEEMETLQLVAELTKEREANSKKDANYWNEQHSKETERADRLQAELKKQNEVNKKLLEGLGWYANEDNHWNSTAWGEKVESNVRKDDGELARNILKAILEGNEPNEG